jgi:hypothetical protein
MVGPSDAAGDVDDRLAENVAALGRLGLGDRHRGQQADHPALGAVHEQLAVEALLHDGRAVDRELDADHHPEHADVHDGVTAVGERAEPMTKHRRHTFDVVEQPVPLDHLDRGDTGGRGDRVAPERGGVHSGS